MRRGNARSFLAVMSITPCVGSRAAIGPGAVFGAMYQYAPREPGYLPAVDVSLPAEVSGWLALMKGGTMNRAPLFLATAALCALPALLAAQTHEMTPEQKAEMEAYQKAGTPGAPHKAMAAQAGTYTTKVKSWHAPGQPPM